MPKQQPRTDMRFQLNVVSCFGLVAPVVAKPTASTTGEVCRLEQMSYNGKKCYRGSGKVGGRKAASPAQWRPSLGTITEDDAVNVEKTENTARPCNKQIKRIESTGSSQVCGYRTYLSPEASFQTSIPTLFPSVFFF